MQSDGKRFEDFSSPDAVYMTIKGNFHLCIQAAMVAAGSLGKLCRL